MEGKIGLRRQYIVSVKPRADLGKVPVIGASATVSHADIGLWHERMGHISSEALRKTAQMVDGMKIIPGSGISYPCISCEMGKGHRDPFPASSSRASTPLELMHVDKEKEDRP